MIGTFEYSRVFIYLCRNHCSVYMYMRTVHYILSFPILICLFFVSCAKEKKTITFKDRES